MWEGGGGRGEGVVRNGTDFQKRKKRFVRTEDQFSSRGTFTSLTTCQDQPSQTPFQLGNGMVVKSTLHGPSPALEGCMGWGGGVGVGVYNRPAPPVSTTNKPEAITNQWGN